MKTNFPLKAIVLAMAMTGTLAGCQSASQTTTNETQAQQADVMQAEAEKLNQLVDTFFNENLELNPVYATFVGVHDYNDRFSLPLTEESQAKRIAFNKRYLEAVNKIDSSKLSGQSLLSYEIFKRDREMALKGFEFPAQMIPLDQMQGFHNYFAMMGSGSSVQPFNTYQDYKNFESRSKGFAEYMASAVVQMRKGMETGVVLPKAIIAKVVPQLRAHVVDDIAQSVFYGPVKALDENTDISDEQKSELRESFTATITDVIIPAFRDTADFMDGEYKEKGRDTVGYSSLPNGKAWYEYQIATNTTLPLSAEEIHEFGQQEVARILSEMKKVKETVGFEGDLPAFFTHLKEDDQFYFESEQAVIDAYENIKEKIDGRVGQLFEVFPKAPYEVRAVEAYRAASAAGASYQRPAPDGSRPGIFYINTHNLKAQPNFVVETLSVHEAAPGHHFQIAIQQEVEGLPAFRKFGGYTVFAEGWALYAESLGKRMGLFTDPYQWYGRLSDEQLRAMRLVVDTGLHAFGWSREKAMEFMRNNSSLAESDIESEVERYIVMPGQALSYKVGERKIRLLREKVKNTLGDKYDIKKFHTQVLIDGALPMPILEAKLDRWMKTQS